MDHAEGEVPTRNNVPLQPGARGAGGAGGAGGADGTSGASGAVCLQGVVECPCAPDPFPLIPRSATGSTRRRGGEQCMLSGGSSGTGDVGGDCAQEHVHAQEQVHGGAAERAAEAKDDRGLSLEDPLETSILWHAIDEILTLIAQMERLEEIGIEEPALSDVAAAVEYSSNPSSPSRVSAGATSAAADASEESGGDGVSAAGAGIHPSDSMSELAGNQPTRGHGDDVQVDVDVGVDVDVSNEDDDEHKVDSDDDDNDGDDDVDVPLDVDVDVHIHADHAAAPGTGAAEDEDGNANAPIASLIAEDGDGEAGKEAERQQLMMVDDQVPEIDAGGGSSWVEPASAVLDDGHAVGASSFVTPRKQRTPASGGGEHQDGGDDDNNNDDDDDDDDEEEDDFPSPQKIWLQGLKLHLDRSSFQSRARRALHKRPALSDLGTWPYTQDDIEDAVESLELLCAKLVEVEKAMQDALVCCRETQMRNTLPIISACQERRQEQQAQLHVLKADEARLRDEFDGLSHQTAKVKETVRTARDLAVGNSTELRSNLKQVRIQRDQAAQELEGAIRRRNEMQVRIGVLTALLKELRRDIDERDYTVAMELASSKHFARSFASQDEQEKHMFALQRLSQLHRSQLTGEAKLRDVRTARAGIRSRIAHLVASYWR